VSALSNLSAADFPASRRAAPVYEHGRDWQMEIAYVDESYDAEVFVMSALTIPARSWRDSFTVVQDYRKHLKREYGVFTSKELHATTFLAGRGRVGSRIVPKGLRAHIFGEYLRMLTGLSDARIISGAWLRAGESLDRIHAKAFSRIQERLETRSRRGGWQTITIVDEGRAKELHRIARKSKVWNPVGSAYGAWEGGSTYKNIPNEHLIEDPVFKRSDQSYFLQSADFIAYALLKSEVAPTPRVERYGLDKAYELLEPILAIEASRPDPRRLGIVRT